MEKGRMNVRVVDLTREVGEGTEAYGGGEPAVRIERLMRVESDGCELSRFSLLGCHAGTHLDSPLHFIPGGSDIASLPLRVLPATVVCARVKAVGTEAFPEAEFLAGRAVLVHTRWDVRLGTPSFYREAPFITPDAARFLVEAGVALVGIDSPSVDPFDSRDFPTHRTLLGSGVLVVEGLINLGEVTQQRGTPYFLALPLRVRGIEGSPVRAVALFLDAD
jgi:arylformamidase